MITRLGLISDIHANPAPLEEALAIFKQQNVDFILCPGDIAGYGDSLNETIDLLEENKCQTILGNHELWYLEKPAHFDTKAYHYLKSLPFTLEITLEDKNLYMVHANPPDSVVGGIRLLDKNGAIIPEQKILWTTQLTDFDYDVLIVGHTHQVFAEQLGNTLVINPGSTTYNHSCAILSLPDLTIEFYSLSKQPILKSWNWGSNQLT
jgi:putative phosphoesterase